MTGAEKPEPAGQLERTLRAGHFALTAETTPPLDSEGAAVIGRAGCLKGLADAINVTDGAGARTHLSSLAAAAFLARESIEPVLQFTCRDRNRLAVQADLLGASAFGIHNILALHGDDITAGDQPDAKMVHDLDSRGILTTARTMCRDGVLPSGREIATPPRLFLGAADTPFDPPVDWQPDGLMAKIEAGAQFVQTQYAFDMAVLRRYMTRLAEHGIPDRLFFLIGIGPLASAKAARWMDKNLFGVHIPEVLIKRLEGATDQRAEGRRMCIELLQELQEIPGVSGAHLMAPRQEAESARVIEESGLLKKRN